ncbi:UvrD-helicase domain-containing protein [Fusobacterium varium]|uniref:UvrD-helicase domain-containing protein n=1 Tax=Fusobacterium varium TaxID=856 RepID=UPI001F3A569B|nr:UvrD-helicase domain-containing protein [Fusobacterium varium]MCF2674056.1 ATP-dependent helicase [Fusobacterium varium]
MGDIYISDEEIKEVEKILLPNSCYFSEDARNVVRCWKSSEIVACPGSGKTTVLLAKLKILAERMPFSDGTGVCVLSHTNVAVNEIKTKLNRYADKLMSYPNYVGTIQSFIDQYVVKPYLKNITKTSIQVVDDVTYANHFYNLIWSNMHRTSPYHSLRYFIKFQVENGSNKFGSQVDYIQNLYFSNEGLFVRGKNKAIAGKNSDSASQYIQAKESLLKEEGIITYSGAYKYATEAISNLSLEYTDLFSQRFQYVFVDEYQDCDSLQRQVLNKLFDKNKTCVFHIGDPDQAIYSSEDSQEIGWTPNEDCIEMLCSNRYGQEIADFLVNLRTGNREIKSSKGCLKYIPTLIVFNNDSRNKVIEAFINVLTQYNLYDSNGVYKVIGLVKREELKGLKIGDYWDGFDPKQNMRNLNRYWNHIYRIAGELEKGKLYSAEKEVRKILCKLFDFMGIMDSESNSKYMVISIRKILLDKYCDIYADCLINLSTLQDYNIDEINNAIVDLANEIIGKECDETDVFSKIPSYYLDKSILKTGRKLRDNIIFDESYKRKIVFDTVHGVKGETHDATLYVETEKNRSSDIKRVLPYLGVGKLGKGVDVERSRKCVYVGMSRPSKLLCLAVQESTYTKSGSAFSNWNIVDCRCELRKV